MVRLLVMLLGVPVLLGAQATQRGDTILVPPGRVIVTPSRCTTDTVRLDSLLTLLQAQTPHTATVAKVGMGIGALALLGIGILLFRGEREPEPKPDHPRKEH